MIYILNLDRFVQINKNFLKLFHIAKKIVVIVSSFHRPSTVEISTFIQKSATEMYPITKSITNMKKSKKGCDLKSCFFCKGCLKEWIPAIEANRETFEVKKGELLFKEGDPVTGIYFVNEGKVKVHKKWGNDKELIVRIANKGTIVGHRGLGSNTVYPVSGTALEPAKVCFIDLDFFQTTLKVNHEFTYQLMMFFADELQESERKMRNLAHMPVKGRIAQALLTLKEKFGVTKEGFINIILSRQDLASYTGTTYETVFRIMNEFIENDIIKVTDKNISIINVEKLLSLTKETH
jgi:CRP-like cAMP-binding protein